MTLSLIVGKPGSGKSYFAVSRIIQDLEDWARYELEHEKPFDRTLWTNIPLDVEEICIYLSEKLDAKIDATPYVNVLDDSFFQEDDGHKVEWWEKFPPGALIVIDEVHHYLGEEQTYSRDTYRQHFRDYVSMHRHKQHDIMFLTQSTENLMPTVLRMAEDAYIISNLKSMSWPWPISIPMGDVFVVKEAWGNKNQFIRVIRGTYLGRALHKENVTNQLLLNTIFRLYRSHTKSDTASDRPSMQLTRIGSLIWFTRRHAWHLILKAAVLFFVLYIGWNILNSIPKAIQAAFGGLNPATTETKPADPPPAAPAAAPPILPVAVAPPVGGPVRVSIPFELSHNKTDDKIQGFLPSSVITDRGTLRAGDTIVFEGRDRKIKHVDFRQRKVRLIDGGEVK